MSIPMGHPFHTSHFNIKYSKRLPTQFFFWKIWHPLFLFAISCMLNLSSSPCLLSCIHIIDHHRLPSLSPSNLITGHPHIWHHHHPPSSSSLLFSPPSSSSPLLILISQHPLLRRAHLAPHTARSAYTHPSSPPPPRLTHLRSDPSVLQRRWWEF